MNPAEAIEALIEAQWSQVDIAKQIDVSPSSISKILSGTSPKYETGVALIALARKEAARIKRQESRHVDS